MQNIKYYKKNKKKKKKKRKDKKKKKRKKKEKHYGEHQTGKPFENTFSSIFHLLDSITVFGELEWLRDSLWQTYVIILCKIHSSAMNHDKDKHRVASISELVTLFLSVTNDFARPNFKLFFFFF